MEGPTVKHLASTQHQRGLEEAEQYRILNQSQDQERGISGTAGKLYIRSDSVNSLLLNQISCF